MAAPSAPTPQAKPPVPELQYLAGFKFLFNDANWGNNLLIGSVFNIIPVVGPIIVLGWFCEIMQRLTKGAPQPIPKLDFSDFVYYLQRGLIPFVVMLIIILPMTIIIGVVVVILVVLTGALASQSHSPETLVPVLVLWVLFLFALIFIPMAVLSNAVLTRAYLTEDFGAALQLGKIIAYAKATWKNVLKAYFVYLPLTFGITLVGMMALYFGMFPAMLICNLAWVYLAWQIYEINLAEGGEAIPVKANPAPIPSEVAAAQRAASPAPK